MPTVEEVIRRLDWCGTERVAMALWCETDVLYKAMELEIECSREEARDIIDDLDNHQDCSTGISWGDIECLLEELDHTRREESAQGEDDARLTDR